MKAVGLFSGGLDSTLAIKLMLEQGIEMVALNFQSPFCRCQRGQGCNLTLGKRARYLGASFKSIYLGEEYLDIVRNPKHGYGTNLNPCIDCRILKLKKAKIFMERIEASFVVTGEVLGQRPMSQHRQALELIEKETGLEGLVLRPLSAKLFEPTLPEKKGWVNREALLDISGRTRKPQIGLAAQLGIKDYPCPAGGCLLTDPAFSKRLKDVFEHEAFDLDNIELLKIGRHFRITSDFKLVVGRNEKENSRLIQCRHRDDLYFEPKDLPGPSALGRGRASVEIKELSSRIISRYISEDQKVEVTVSQGVKPLEVLSVTAIGKDQLEKFRIN